MKRISFYSLSFAVVTITIGLPTSQAANPSEQKHSPPKISRIKTVKGPDHIPAAGPHGHSSSHSSPPAHRSTNSIEGHSTTHAPSEHAPSLHQDEKAY